MPDPLSDVLSLLDVRSARCKRLEAGGAWAMRFPGKAAFKFAAVLSGRCWMIVEGQGPVRLEQGDAFLLANAPPYVLASDCGLTPTDGFAAYDQGRADNCRLGGDDTVLLGGEFTVEAGSAQLLLDALPTFMPVPATARAATILRDTLLLLDSEIRSDAIGRSLMMRRLADIAFLQALRAFVDENDPSDAKWIGALTDPRIAAALSCMHQDPARAWSVADLARCAGMSRSGFAARFQDLVGASPLQYLTRWRMERARDALRRGGISLRRISRDAGYASEGAFGFAFKRAFGCSPRGYGSASLRPSTSPDPIRQPDALRSTSATRPESPQR